METTNLASLVDESFANKTFYTVTETPSPSPVPTTLSANYPAGGSEPNADNQAYFKSQPLTWWVNNLNGGNVQYYPFSNEVNWAYFPEVTDKNTCFHIAVEITNVVVPNMTDTMSRNPPADGEQGRGSVVITMRPNSCLKMTVTRPGF